MTALIVIGVILLILAIFLFMPVRIYLDFTDGRQDAVLKYFFIKKSLMTKESETHKSSKQKKPKRKSRTEKKKSKDGDKEKKDDKKKSGGLIPSDLRGKLDFALSALGAAGKLLKTTLRGIRITGLFIDFKVADLDAYDCAVRFGKVNMALYNGLRVLGSVFTVKKESINVRCAFNEEKSVYDIRCCIKARPETVLRAGILFIFTFLVNTIKKKVMRKKQEQDENLKAA